MKKCYLLKIYLAVIVGLGSTYSAQSQHTDVYTWDSYIDLPVIGTGVGTALYTFLREPSGRQLTTEEIYSLDRSEVSSWERSATFNWSETADSWSDIFQLSSYAMPLTLMTSSRIRKDAGKIALLYAEVMLLNTGITGALKVTVRRKRPFVFNEEAPVELKYRRQVFYSFISGHTSSSAATSFLTAKIFSDYYPDSPYKKFVWAGAALLPAITGYLRYEAGKHFLSDVAVGYFTGAAIGIFIPEIHKVQAFDLPVKVSVGSIQGSAGIKLTVDLSRL